MRRRPFVVFVVVLLSLAFVFWTGWNYYVKTQEQRQAVRQDLSALCDSFPVPDGLKRSGDQEVINPESGVVSFLFETELACDDAENPYYEFWSSHGWSPTGDRSAYYFKNHYVVKATCKPAYFKGNPNQVKVECGWDKNGEKKNILK
jgi:hypothetical protein